MAIGKPVSDFRPLLPVFVAVIGDQPPLWLANVEMDMASTSLLFVFLLQFFRGSLDLRRNFPILNRVFLAGIAFYLLMVVLNVGSY